MFPYMTIWSILIYITSIFIPLIGLCYIVVFMDIYYMIKKKKKKKKKTTVSVSNYIVNGTSYDYDIYNNQIFY